MTTDISQRAAYGLTLAEFQERIAGEFHLEIEQLALEHSLEGDLGFDSLQALELAILLEELSGGLLSDAELLGITTVCDAYNAYLKMLPDAAS